MSRRHPHVVHVDEVAVVDSPHGKFAPRERYLAAAAGGQQLGCSLVELAPGATAWPFHYHCANEEAIYVLEGTGTARIGDARVEIRAGDTDGNQATDPDPSWESFCVNPPTWEYPSAHAMQSAAAAEMLVSTLGTDSVAFTVTSTTAPPERPERSFTSLRGAAAEAADSRVLCGIHFRYATDAGLALGRALAQSILRRQLRPHRRLE